jgi:hypothetical protein
MPSPRRNMPRRRRVSTSTRFACATNLLGNRLVVLEVLLRPFVGFWIALWRRDPTGGCAWIFTVAGARKRERYPSAVAQNGPYLRVPRHAGVLKPFPPRPTLGLTCVPAQAAMNAGVNSGPTMFVPRLSRYYWSMHALISRLPAGTAACGRASVRCDNNQSGRL